MAGEIYRMLRSCGVDLSEQMLLSFVESFSSSPPHDFCPPVFSCCICSYIFADAISC